MEIKKLSKEELFYMKEQMTTPELIFLTAINTAEMADRIEDMEKQIAQLIADNTILKNSMKLTENKNTVVINREEQYKDKLPVIVKLYFKDNKMEQRFEFNESTFNKERDIKLLFDNLVNEIKKKGYNEKDVINFKFETPNEILRDLLISDADFIFVNG